MTTITYDEAKEDIIVIHLGKVVSDELYNEIQESIIKFLDSRWPINKPVEKEYTPYIPNTTPWYQQNLNLVPKECYEPGGTCTNPHMDCVNCPRIYNKGTYTAATREIPTTMKEE